MKTQKRQAVVRIHGDYDLVEWVLDLIEQRSEGMFSKVMKSGYGGEYHAFATILKVVEAEE